MYRAIPVVNKACYERNLKRNHDSHRLRISKMRPCIDNTKPETCALDHIRNNLKREQLMEDRYNEIDRDNRILLNKMSDIMKKEQHPVAARSTASLNRDGRKQELMRITHENNAILGRIQRVQPVSTCAQWAEDYRRSTEYVKNRCEFPPPLLKKKSLSRSCSSLTPLMRGSTGGASATGSASPAAGRFQASGSLPSLAAGNDPPLRLEAGAVNCTGIATERPGQKNPDALSYVLKEGRCIGNRYFLVEMSTDGRTLTISAYDGDSQKTLELIVNEKNHRKIYRECNGDYALIGARVRCVLAGERGKEEKLALDFPVGGLEHGLGPQYVEGGPLDGKANWQLPGSAAPATFKK